MVTIIADAPPFGGTTTQQGCSRERRCVVLCWDSQIRQAAQLKEVEYQQALENEIQKRKDLADRFAREAETQAGILAGLSKEDVCGNYDIAGRNPRSLETGITGATHYHGGLKIERYGSLAMKATWRVMPTSDRADDQIIEGLGVVHGRTASYAFTLPVPDQPSQLGVVTYDVLTSEIMRGRWVAAGAYTIGFEECRRHRDAETARLNEMGGETGR